MTLNFRHQRLGPWDGHGYKAPNRSTGGCSSLGIDSAGQFGLVYKATTNKGGIYRTLSRHENSPHTMIQPIHINNIPQTGKFVFSI